MIPFLDIKSAYAELKPELDAAYHRVMDSGWFVLGKEVEAFEAEYAAFCGTRHCVGLGNGLEALELELGKSLVKTKHAKFVVGCRIRELLRQVEYKARWSSQHFVPVGRFFPSTKLCSGCGYKNDSLSLSDREWTCPACSTHHLRDLNSAKNVKSEGLKIVAAGYRRR